MFETGIAEETSAAAVTILPWVYHWRDDCSWCNGVFEVSGFRSYAVRDHMFVQGEQDSYECF